MSQGNTKMVAKFSENENRKLDTYRKNIKPKAL